MYIGPRINKDYVLDFCYKELCVWVTCLKFQCLEAKAGVLVLWGQLELYVNNYQKGKKKLIWSDFTVLEVRDVSLITVSSSPWDWPQGFVHVTKAVYHRGTTPMSVFFYFIKVPEMCRTGKQQCYMSSHFLITIRKTLNSFTIEYNILQTGFNCKISN